MKPANTIPISVQKKTIGLPKHQKKRRRRVLNKVFFVSRIYIFFKLLVLELFSIIPPTHDPNLQSIIDGYGQLDWNFVTLEAYELIKNTIEHLMYNDENWIENMVEERKEYVLQVSILIKSFLVNSESFFNTSPL